MTLFILMHKDASMAKVEHFKSINMIIYSDDSLIRTHLFPPEISGLTSFPDY